VAAQVGRLNNDLLGLPSAMGAYGLSGLLWAVYASSLA
jgi:hypothetical protein